MTQLNQSKHLKVIIVGGGGYIGYFIGLDLHQKGHEVTLFDLSEPDPEWLEDTNVPLLLSDKSSTEISRSMRFIRGSVTSLQELENAFSIVKATVVIHCASYGMSGKEQMPLHWDYTELINVGGTQNVISACCTCGISSLIYTSTYNVVFGGNEIINGNESLPYFPIHRHVDHYSRTKSIAEQLVIMADRKGHTSNQKGSLRTCALRLAGVMGVKEKRHLPRIVGNFPILKFRYGSEDNRVQFVSLPNVVQAHVKATEMITRDPDLVGGQAYFISDGIPIHNFEYFKPLMEKLGYPYPKIIVPMFFIWFAAYFSQFSYAVVTRINPKWAFTPFLSPCEVYKTSVTHFMDIDKAQKHFGYVPENPNDLTLVAEYFYQKKCKEENSLHIKNPTLYLIFVVVIFLVTVLCKFQ